MSKNSLQNVTFAARYAFSMYLQSSAASGVVNEMVISELYVSRHARATTLHVLRSPPRMIQRTLRRSLNGWSGVSAGPYSGWNTIGLPCSLARRLVVPIETVERITMIGP